MERTGERRGPGALTLDPIGTARTPFRELAEAPRQPAAARGVRGCIELEPGRGFDHALEGLGEWSHVWVLFWFHLAHGSVVRKVRPPRSGEKRGVLATRSPHRPNPLGLSLVRLLEVRGLVLEVEDIDLVDGTPVLDIKPYVPYTDTAADASSGWLPGAADPATTWTVELSADAEAQLAFIEAATAPSPVSPAPPPGAPAPGAPGLRERLVAALALGPAPHPYRRIRANEDGRWVIAVKAWRATFTFAHRTIHVQRITSGYRPRDLVGGTAGDLEIHRAFSAAFPVRP